MGLRLRERRGGGMTNDEAIRQAPRRFPDYRRPQSSYSLRPGAGPASEACCKPPNAPQVQVAKSIEELLED